MLSAGQPVTHPKFGNGVVVADQRVTAIIRFQHGVEECPVVDLAMSVAPLARLREGRWDDARQAVARIQAEAILSVNDTWGVFSRSKIELLPHQLWVCKQVNSTWPTRWLVADDVGLGKTIEAGMILWPLLSRGTVQRLLILCPASLVEQWQYRLKTMFDIRVRTYFSEADTEKSDFWETNDRIIASLQTLRQNKSDKDLKRQQRLFNSKPWDMLIVDEAHHLNTEQDNGKIRYTLGYALVRELENRGRIGSMVFYTGTPHRGKDCGFISLLQLLRKDLFDNRKPAGAQLGNLPRVMIRNNKSHVTDMSGKPLFKDLIVSSETYEYSEAEQRFYWLLTNFIEQGRIYANTLSTAQQSTVILVLIAMQKLASSSVAAIRRALRRRLDRLHKGRGRIDELKKLIAGFADLRESGNEDLLAEAEARLAEESEAVALLADEEPALRSLLAAAEAVKEETKIQKIADLVGVRYEGRSVLFFTEYKATQSLLMSKLMARYGEGCVTFINGDGRAQDVVLPNGQIKSVAEDRVNAKDLFNKGKVRFLVSTEAAGEGIDLQVCCHTLIHVDLPWNPMRMHQRVGRLNRYGQTKQVEVLSLRNPSTVESRVWEKLNTKIARINEALRAAMKDPEDMLQLVLGMTSQRMFNDIHFEAASVQKESFDQWFDRQTSEFGGKDVIDTVKAIVGNVNHFEFGAVSGKLPRVDLQDLRPFLENILAISGAKPTRKTERGISFGIPPSWRREKAILQANYEDMIFRRTDEAKDADRRILGVGHPLINFMLSQGQKLDASVAAISAKAISRPLVVFRVYERDTTRSDKPTSIIAAVEVDPLESRDRLLKDWQLLQILNNISLSEDLPNGKGPSERPSEADSIIRRSEEFLGQNIQDTGQDFRVPGIDLLALFWPAQIKGFRFLGLPECDINC